MRSSINTFIELRGIRHHVREWGGAGEGPTIFLLHGWGDASATFQFLADEMGPGWHLVAPDWRGFGRSARCGDAYWFPDYLADLDALLKHYRPHGQVNLVGHSMGGNVACMYAGVRPSRVRKLVALDAFGLPDRGAEEAPGRFEKWLNQLASPDGFRSYPAAQAFARRLMRDNPRLREGQALFLAGELTEPDGLGGVRVAIDPAHRNVNPVLYRRTEVEACWRRVVAEVLWLVQADPAWRRKIGVDDATYREACACFRHFSELQIADSGHNMHHDQPAVVAAHLIEFFGTQT